MNLKKEIPDKPYTKIHSGMTLEEFSQVIVEISKGNRPLTMWAGEGAKDKFIESARKEGLPDDLINSMITKNGNGTYTITTEIK